MTKPTCPNFKNVIGPYMDSINNRDAPYWPIHFVEDSSRLKGSIYILPYENSIKMSRMFEPNCLVKLQVEFFDVEIKPDSTVHSCYDELQFLQPGTNKLSSGMADFPRCLQVCDPAEMYVATPDDTRFEIRFTSDDAMRFKGAKINWLCRNRQIELVYKIREMSHEQLDLQMRMFSHTDQSKSMNDTVQINRAGGEF